MGRPKALLPVRGRTFLENILDAISLSSLGQTVVVVGHHRQEIQDRFPSTPFVFNAEYEEGMITSFQTGIRALDPGCSGAFLFLVDHPLADPRTIEALMVYAGVDRIVLPSFEGRRGHPVFFGSRILQEILALPASQGANAVVRKDPGRIVEVAVEDPGILVDVDTPEEFRRLGEEES